LTSTARQHFSRQSSLAFGRGTLFFLLLTFTSCSKKDAQPVAFVSPQPATTAVDAATSGIITGVVYLDGPAPVLPVINMQSEAGCAKTSASVASAQPVVAGANGTLANVVVYVTDGLASYRLNPPQSPVLLDQKGCLYDPRVVALMTNQTLEIHNSDATIHNVHAMPKTNSEWNKAQPAGGAVLKTSFPKPELAIPFMCNVHPWMRAFVFVFDHPYFAVTAPDGKFTLTNVPPGTYKVEAWQEKLGTRTQVVTVRPHGSSDVSFRFNSEVLSK
jgi:hypothetical protein